MFRHIVHLKSWDLTNLGAVSCTDRFPGVFCITTQVLIKLTAGRFGEEEQDEAEPGQVARQSKGADLAALLSESLQLDRTVLYRSRCVTEF